VIVGVLGRGQEGTKLWPRGFWAIPLYIILLNLDELNK